MHEGGYESNKILTGNDVANMWTKLNNISKLQELQVKEVVSKEVVSIATKSLSEQQFGVLNYSDLNRSFQKTGSTISQSQRKISVDKMSKNFFKRSAGSMKVFQNPRKSVMRSVKTINVGEEKHLSSRAFLTEFENVGTNKKEGPTSRNFILKWIGVDAFLMSYQWNKEEPATGKKPELNDLFQLKRIMLYGTPGSVKNAFDWFMNTIRSQAKEYYDKNKSRVKVNFDLVVKKGASNVRKSKGLSNQTSGEKKYSPEVEKYISNIHVKQVSIKSLLKQLKESPTFKIERATTTESSSNSSIFPPFTQTRGSTTISSLQDDKDLEI